MSKELKKFQTTNLADYYSDNGSQYSTRGDTTHFSAGGTRYDNTSPITQNLSNQTPLDSFIDALKNPQLLSEVQEKSGIEVFSLPSTPTKIGISATSFTFAPAFTVPNTTGFTFAPPGTTQTPNTFNFISSFDTGLIGSSVSNNMSSPINAGISVYNGIATPNHGYGILGIHDEIPNINATGFTPNTFNSGPSEFQGISGVPGAMSYAHTGNYHGILSIHDQIPNINATGFTPNTVHLGSSEFTGISGGPAPGTFSYTHTGNQGLGILGIWDGTQNFDAVGFVPNKHHLSVSDFMGIGGEGHGNMQYNFIDRGGLGQIWGWTRSIYNDKIGAGVDNMSNTDAVGFIRNKAPLSNSDFAGITGAAPDMKFDFNTIVPAGSSQAWTRAIYDAKIGIPVDGFGNQKASGFTLNKSHKSVTDFKGYVSGQPYSYPTDPSPRQSYIWNDTYYNIVDATKPPTAPSAKDGIGQTFSVDHGGHVTGKKARFTSGIELVGSFKTRVEDLYKSLPLRDEAHNSGFYGKQPYVTRDIGSNWSLFSDGPGPVHGDSLIRGGIGTSLNRALHDISRIGQYMISPSGLLFIAKNIGMQLSNPKWQGATLFGTVSRTRVYPIGLSTLAQVAVNGIGIHLVRHGFGPLEGDGTHYEKTVDERGRTNYTKGTVYGPFRKKNRLYKLGKEMGVGYFDKDTLKAVKPRKKRKNIFAKFGRWAKKKLKKLLVPREKISTISGLFGPHSLYGIGRTRIYKSDSGFDRTLHTNLTGTHGDAISLTTHWGNQEGKIKSDDPNPRAENPNFIHNSYTMGEKKGDGLWYGANIKGGKDSSPDDVANDSERAGDLGSMVQPDGKMPPSMRDFLHSKDYSTGMSHRYEAISYGQIGKIQENRRGLNDFREYMFSSEKDGIDLGIANKIMQQPNKGDDGQNDDGGITKPWRGEDYHTRFGRDYGKPGKNISDRNSPTWTEDKSVFFDKHGYPEPYNSMNKTTEGITPEPFDDLILFQFKTLDDVANQLQFRAFLTDLSDTFSPQWEEVSYIGRTSPTYLFKSISREASFSFNVYAFTQAELDANYKRLNNMLQIIGPAYKSSKGLPVAPLLKLTIGDYFTDIPIAIDSFEIKVAAQSPWDIDKGRQLPYYLDVSVGCKILFAEPQIYDPQKGNFNAKSGNRVFRRDSVYFSAINKNFNRETPSPLTEA